MATLQTERLLLRAARADDVNQLHAVFSNPKAMKYWSTLPHADISLTAEFIAAMIKQDQAQGEDFVVEHNDVVIGKAGFWRFPEIGFIFHPNYWRKGLAQEAVSALIAYGFQQRKLTKITADVDPRNAGSIRLLTRLGFHETHRATHTFQIGDEWVDSIYFRLKRPGCLC